MTAPDVVVELTAAAETLRGSTFSLYDFYHHDCEEARQEDWCALATLIDTTVQEHWLTMAQWGGEQVVCCGRCKYGDGACYRSPCPTLTALATYTRTVLGSTQ